MNRPCIALVGERDPAKTAHRGIEASFALYREDGEPAVDCEWIPTARITPESVEPILRDFAAIWCAPGSPYSSTEGALLAIRHARTGRRPFLGTCGGFQHALLEFAQNVLHHAAAHEELTPAAPDPLISRLSCPLVGMRGTVIATRPELFAEIMGARESVEEFHCNYGVNHRLAGLFAGSDLVFVAHDEHGQERAFRLRGHPFFVGTLFQPERRALTGAIHPLVASFFRAASRKLRGPTPVQRAAKSRANPG